MRVFFDTEFYEFRPDGFDYSVQPEFRPLPKLLPGANAVQLISLGAVREDGAQFYVENSLFDWGVVPAGHWLRDNVRPLLHPGFSYTPEFIADEFLEFCGPNPEFWACYADYDWVVLCGLYGRMVDLPSGWPMFCRDLRQLMDRRPGRPLPTQETGQHHALHDALWVRKAWEALQ